MKNFVYIIFGALLFVGCTADLEDQRVSGGDVTLSEKVVNCSEGAVKGAVLVRFEASAESRLAECATRSGATRTGVQGVDAVLDGVNGCAVERVFMVTEKNREKVYERGLHLWYELRFSEESDLDNVASELAKVADVQRVQFIHKVCRTERPKRVMAAQPLQLSAESRAIKNPFPFNDTYRAYQWSLKNLGENSEVKDAGYVSNLPKPVAGADINILPAWNLCKGDPSIVVAVVDEAVMYTHEDLAANMWVNGGEVPGDDIDNDKNGYADDVYGFNFVRLDGNLKWNNSNDTGHGSHVAGIISAVNNNGIGICGIAGGDGTKGGVRIMSIQIFYGNGGATTANTAKGIQYAADNGAHILQCSWGYESALVDRSMPANDAGYKRYCALEAEAIDYFIANAGDKSGPIDGGLVIFAGGNDGVALTAYPAAYQPCIAVAASNPALRPSYYTNYSTGTDITAPGGESLYKNGDVLSCVPSMFQDSTTPNYCLMQGTSQACPHVSGVAALGLSYAKQLGKHYTANEFRSMVLSATNDIEPTLTGSIKISYQNNTSQTVNYPSYKGKLGNGYIDAYKLLLQIDGTPYTTIKTGGDKINLAPYFGDGVYNAALQKIEISDADKATIGLGDCTYSAGKLNVNCSKSGVATVTVTLLFGGGSFSDSKYPYPVEVKKSFVIMVREDLAANGGWL